MSRLLTPLPWMPLCPGSMAVPYSESNYETAWRKASSNCIKSSAYAGMVHKPSCVNQFAISKLLQHQQPRRILLISPDVGSCTKYLGRISPIVRCIHEDAVLLHINKATVQYELETAYPEVREDSHEGLWPRTGWYLQQVCPQLSHM